MAEIMISADSAQPAAVPGPALARTRVQRVLSVLWPAFLVAAVAELPFFALFDPSDLGLFGVPLDAARMPLYTLGFFAFWALCAASGALTVFLQRSPFEVNRCPLEPTVRPVGCPKREAGDRSGPCS